MKVARVMRRTCARYIAKSFNSLVILTLVLQPVGAPGLLGVFYLRPTVLAAEESATPPAEEKVEAPAKEVAEEKEGAPKDAPEKVVPPKEEVQPADTPAEEIAEPVVEGVSTDTVGKTPVENPSDTSLPLSIEPTEESAVSGETSETSQESTQEEVMSTISATATAVETSAEEIVCLSASVQASDEKDWMVDGDKAVTTGPVELGVRYVYPLDEEVTITFTCLPTDLSKRAPLSIERFKASDLKLPAGTVAVSKYAYDITTEGMENGSFKYDLTLPKMMSSDVDATYIEMKADEVKEKELKKSDLKKVDEEKVDNRSDSVVVEGMDHLTVYVLTQSVIATSSQTINNSACMEDAAGKKLQCAANDISIASVSNITILDDGCTSPLDTVEFTADWLVQSTASQRYDIGLYFASGGQTSALNGLCSVSTLPKIINLDNDACGDITSAAPLTTTITMEVSCQDPDFDNLLNLPYCTSWDNNAGGVCNGPANTIPGTGSKCNCNDGFPIPITVPFLATIEVQKNLVPSGDTGKFNLQVNEKTEATDVGHNGSTGKIPVGAGTSLEPGAVHTVGEEASSGTSLTDYASSISCVKRGTATVVASASGTGPLNVPVQKDDDILCTITNTRKTGTITIIKDAVPNDAQDFTFSTTGAGLSNFSLDDDSDATLSNTQTFTGILPGTYTVTEAVAPGFDLTGLTCDDPTQDSNGNLGTRTATINLASNETVTCTFTNTKKPMLTLVKQVKNDNGGTAVASAWTLHASGPTPISGVTGSASVTNATVNAGTYTLSETGGPTGYIASDWKCTGTGTQNSNTLTLNNGQSATCTITNDDQPGTLIVKKVVINDNGGNARPEDFSFQVNGGSSIGFEADGQNDIVINAGVYTVVENVTTGYATTYDNCTGITVPNDGSATCTITNDDIAPRITLNKVVIKNNGGTAGVNDFGLTIGGTAVASGQTLSVSANTPITLNETGLPGYSFVSITGDNKCPKVLGGAVTLDEGESITCTITNDDQPAYLTIVKHVINDHGGTKEASDFTINVTGTNVSTPSFPGSEAGTVVTLDAGSYAVDEVSVFGYAKSLGENCSGSIALGEHKTCTITNDDIQPQLTVIKIVENTEGGDLQPSDFTIRVSGNVVTPTSFQGSASQLVTLNAGGYSVTEDVVSGYAPRYSPDCNGTIAVGETKTCTITNADIAPKLTLVKTVVNDNGGTKQVADFPLFINGNPVMSGVPVVLKANTLYTASETNQYGYTASLWGGDCAADGTITLLPGDDKICTIKNDDIQPKLTVTKVVVNDGFGTKTVSDFPLFVNQTSVTSGVQNGFNAGNYIVSETSQTGYAGVISGDCAANGSVTLSVGDVKSCTITNNDTFGKIIVKKQTLPEGSAQNFTFTPSYGSSFSLSDGQQNMSQALPAGTYSVSETVPAGWDLTSVICSDGSTPDTINLEDNEVVTCVFTNTKRGTITIIKDAIPNDPQDFSFTNNFGSGHLVSFTLDDDGNSSNTYSNTRSFEVLPGTYAVSENSVAGWKLANTSCTDGSPVSAIAVSPGESVTCTFTNKKLGSFTLVKNTIGGNDTFAFVMTGNTLPASASLTTANGTSSQTFTGVDPENTYSVNEIPVPAGWDLTSVSCVNNLKTVKDPASFQIPNGGNVTCTFTNTKRGTIIVEKETNPDGVAGNFTFTGAVAGTITDNGQIVVSNVVPGTYTSTETDPTPAFVLTGIACDDSRSVTPSTFDLATRTATFKVDPGETVKCTFTNSELPTLTLEKTVVNDDGGDAVKADFTPTVGVVGAGNSSPVKWDTSMILSPGNYVAGETTQAGYLPSVWRGDCSENGTVTLAYGDHKTCTIENNDVAPTVTLNKLVVGGTADVDDFGLTVGGKTVEVGKPVTVMANTPIALNEAGLTGYSFASLTGDAGCPTVLGGTVTLDEGGSISCTITNTRDTGILVINKVLDADGNLLTTGDQTVGTAWEFDVFGHGTDISDPLPASTDATGSVTFSSLKTGLYNVTETLQSGYDLVNVVCDSGALQGNTVYGVEVMKDKTTTCTFYNTPNGTLHGFKWHDLNGNGTPDLTEPRLSGWTINLYRSIGDAGYEPTPYKTMTTSEGEGHFGWYWFEHLLPGNYKVCEVMRPGWNQTYPNVEGDDCHFVTLPDDNSNGFQESVNAVVGPEYNFGNLQLGRINVTKYHDKDGDGSQDEGENVLGGWEITLSGEPSVVTGADGKAVFGNLAPNKDYVLGETMKDGWRQTAITCELSQFGPGIMITQPGYAYGHHGYCQGWNQCRDAATCAQKACEANGYSQLVSYGDARPCTQFTNCSLFYNISQDLSYQANWGNWCDVMGVTDIVCSNGGEKVVPVAFVEEEIVDLKEQKQLRVNPGNVWNCAIGNQFITPELTIEKFNNQWDNGTLTKQSGDIVDYTIIITASKNTVSGVSVTDLPPTGFEYVPGSSTASSSLGADHSGPLELSSPYASPGTWNLGNMAAGEVITLSYKAKITTADPGTYKDLAWAVGTDGNQEKIVAQAVVADTRPAMNEDTGVVSERFVGTQVAVTVMPAPQAVDLKKDEKTETRTKRVLGAALPATGAHTFWLLLGGLFLILGSGLIFFGRRKQTSGAGTLMKTLLFPLIGLMIIGFSGTTLANGVDPNISVRIEQPKSPMNTSTFKISFVALDIEGKKLSAQCYKKPGNDIIATTFDGTVSGGNSGTCDVNLPDGTYQFYVVVTAEEGRYNQSADVEVTIATGIPGKPRNYDRNGDTCEVQFTTADDSLTATVEMYRSEELDFIADASTLVQTVVIGPNTNGTIIDPLGNCDDYYYAIRAVSASGRGSDFVGDKKETTRTRTRTIVVNPAAGTVTGALPVTAPQGGLVTEGAVEGVETTQETTGTNEASGAVLGEATSEDMTGGSLFDWIRSHPWWSIIILLLLVSLALYVYRRRFAKNTNPEVG